MSDQGRLFILAHVGNTVLCDLSIQLEVWKVEFE